MFKKTLNNCKQKNGFSIMELLIVLLVIAIVVVMALPQFMTSRRLFKFSGVQRQLVTSFRESRQDAMTQRTAINIKYEDTLKRLVVYGGSYGVFGNPKNKIITLDGDGVMSSEIVYGRPVGASASALGDSTNLTPLSSGAVDVRFQSDGSVIDVSNNPQNRALYFYNIKDPDATAFAISILGAGGRVKLWQFNRGINDYVE